MSQRLEQFLKVMEEANKGLATYDDVKKVIDVVVKHLKDTKANLEQENASYKEKLGKQIDLGLKEIQKLTDKLDSKLNKVDSDLRSENRTTMRYIEQQIADVVEMIPNEYEDSELRAELEALKVRMEEMENEPEEEDNGEMEEMESKISELKEVLANEVKSIKKMVGSITVPSPTNWPRHESFTMNGSDTSVTLEAAVGAAGTAIFAIRYNGQVLDIDNQYTVNGNKINFTFTPASNTTISVSYYG